MPSRQSPSIPDDTYEELIGATIAAVYENGYAELGVRDIDAEFGKSRQLINHYFDGKDELITELLLYILEYDDGQWTESESDDPLARLNQLIDNVLLGSHMDDAEFWVFMTVVYEVQAHSHHNSTHQELITEIADDFVEHLSELVRDGIEQGVFADVDPVRVARAIDDLITGAHVRKINLGQDDAPAETRETIDQFVVSEWLNG